MSRVDRSEVRALAGYTTGRPGRRDVYDSLTADTIATSAISVFNVLHGYVKADSDALPSTNVTLPDYADLKDEIKKMVPGLAVRFFVENTGSLDLTLVPGAGGSADGSMLAPGGEKTTFALRIDSLTAYTVFRLQHSSATGGGSGGGGIWEHHTDAADGQYARLDPTNPGYSPSEGLVCPAQNMSADGSRFFFDLLSASVRGGQTTAGEWDVARRGLYSVAFGRNTVASGIGTASLSGEDNIVQTPYSAVCSGQRNAIDATFGGCQYNFIGGGTTNTIGAMVTQSILTNNGICGGTENSIGDSSNGIVNANFVGGGSKNFVASGLSQANAENNVIAGGSGNSIAREHQAAADNNAICGGIENHVAPIHGGAPLQNNTCSENFVGGGTQNVIRSNTQETYVCRYNVLCGGSSNLITNASACFLGGGGGGGGSENLISDQQEYGVLCGGRANILHPCTYVPTTGEVTSNTIGGGGSNEIGEGAFGYGIHLSNVICGGSGNLVHVVGDAGTAYYARHNAIGGGTNNIIGNGAGPAPRPQFVESCVVGGGSGNTIHAASDASARACTIAGGDGNGIEGIATDVDYATIGGGYANLARNDYAVIGGGRDHTILADYGSICGGQSHTIESTYGAIGGGRDNAINIGHMYCCMPGGYGARSEYEGQCSWANGTFSVAGDAQGTIVTLARGAGTLTDTNDFFDLWVDGMAAPLTVPDDSCWTIRALVVVTSQLAGGPPASYFSHDLVANVWTHAGALNVTVSPPVAAAGGTDTVIYDPAGSIGVEFRSTAANVLFVRVTDLVGLGGITYRAVAKIEAAEIAYP